MHSLEPVFSAPPPQPCGALRAAVLELSVAVARLPARASCVHVLPTRPWMRSQTTTAGFFLAAVSSSRAVASASPHFQGAALPGRWKCGDAEEKFEWNSECASDVQPWLRTHSPHVCCSWRLPAAYENQETISHIHVHTLPRPASSFTPSSLRSCGRQRGRAESLGTMGWVWCRCRLITAELARRLWNRHEKYVDGAKAIVSSLAMEHCLHQMFGGYRFRCVVDSRTQFSRLVMHIESDTFPEYVSSLSRSVYMCVCM